MTVEKVIRDLRDELQTVSESDTRQFLDDFAPIHVEWHTSRRFDGMDIGFLSFHHEVIIAHTAILKKNGEKVQKAMTRPRPAYRKHIDTVTDPEHFSNDLEDWHNSVHMNHIYPMDFMNPAKNIYMDLFWRFHTLIDNKFTAWIKRNSLEYGELDHTAI
jgi:hypothetical protein